MSETMHTQTPSEPTVSAKMGSAPQPSRASNRAVKFKLSLAGMVVAASSGVTAYLAHDRGMLNTYLPNFAQKTAITPAVQTPNLNSVGALVGLTSGTEANNPSTPSSTTNIASDSNTSSALANNAAAPATHSVATAAPQPIGTPAPSESASTGLSVGTSNMSNPPATNNSVNTNAAENNPSTTPPSVSPPQLAAQNTPSTNTPNPSTQSSTASTGVSTQTLVTTMDAQTKWQALQLNFSQHWDTQAALDQVQPIKNQLKTDTNPTLLPSVTALSEFEGQMQMWHQLNPKGAMTALEHSINNLGQLTIRSAPEAEAQPAQMDVWQRFLSSIKTIFSIKRVPSEQEKLTTAANAATIKQGIQANLMSAQLSARSGQWSAVQEQLRQAQGQIQAHGQGYSLDAALNPLLNQAAWPNTPDFSQVQKTLEQARAQLANGLKVQLPKASPLPTPANQGVKS